VWQLPLSSARKRYDSVAGEERSRGVGRSSFRHLLLPPSTPCASVHPMQGSRATGAAAGRKEGAVGRGGPTSFTAALEDPAVVLCVSAMEAAMSGCVDGGKVVGVAWVGVSRMLSMHY
jgi:hypothetical protein